MGGGNAQKSAIARQRNAEKNSKSKVCENVIISCLFFTYVLSRTLAVERKVKKLEVVVIWQQLWPQLKQNERKLRKREKRNNLSVLLSS
jgi:hypothetical protein